MTLPLRPHLYWGGTGCPGECWPEWVPQLRDFIAKEDEMDDAEFNRRFAKAVKEAPVLAYDDAGKPVGSPHPVGLYLYRIRQLQARAKATGIKRGDTVKLV